MHKINIGDVVAIGPHESGQTIPEGTYTVSRVNGDGSFHVGGNTAIWPSRIVSKPQTKWQATLAYLAMKNGGRLNAPTVTCPDCEGERGWTLDDGPRTQRYDERHNETYYGNWEDCPRCGGSGEVEADEVDL